MNSLKIYSLVCLFCAIMAKSQVGIGTETPNASAVLDVQSDNKGFLYPRMTTAERSAISGPAEGLQVFDTDINCMMLFTNSQWECFPKTASLNTNVVGVIQYTEFIGFDGNSRVILPTAISYNPQNWVSLNSNRLRFTRPGKYQVSIYAYARRQNQGDPSADNSYVSISLKSVSTSKSLTGYIDLPGLSDAVNSVVVKNIIDVLSAEEFELIYRKENAIEQADPHSIHQPYIVIRVLE